VNALARLGSRDLRYVTAWPRMARRPSRGPPLTRGPWSPPAWARSSRVETWHWHGRAAPLRWPLGDRRRELEAPSIAPHAV